MKKGCEYEQQREKLFRSDYLQCLEALETCSIIDISISCFREALSLFSDGADLSSILKILKRSPRFKTALTKDN